MSRIQMLMGATALLYLGPLLAGLTGLGWQTTGPFVALFLIWLAVMRPELWPLAGPEGWRQPALWARALVMAAVQLVLVTVLFAIGRGLGGVAALEGLLPAPLPFLMSALSIPLSRAVWNPVQAQALDQLMDEALARLAAPPVTTPADEARAATRVADWLEPLGAAITPQAMDRALSRLLRGGQGPAVARALQAAAATPEAPPQARLACLCLATDGATVEGLGGDLPTFALHALSPMTSAEAALYARRLTAALWDYPGLWETCPTDALLAQLAARHAGTEAEAPLAALRARLADLVPAD